LSTTLEQVIAAPLVRAFAVVMRDILGDGLPEVVLSERHKAIQTFLFDGAHEALGMGVGIRRAVGGLHDSKPGVSGWSRTARLHFAS
jgi:hypothetical protein